jgi:hypothetical protein
MWIRFATPFGRTDSVYSLVASAFAMLRGRIGLLDRRHHRVSVLVERRA